MEYTYVLFYPMLKLGLKLPVTDTGSAHQLWKHTSGTRLLLAGTYRHCLWAGAGMQTVQRESQTTHEMAYWELRYRLRTSAAESSGRVSPRRGAATSPVNDVPDFLLPSSHLILTTGT